MANSVDPDQTAHIGAVCFRDRLFTSILNSSVMLGNYLQRTTSADDIFRCIFFLGALRVKIFSFVFACICHLLMTLKKFRKTISVKQFGSRSGLTICLA